MSSPTIAGFAAWYVEQLLGALIIGLVAYEIWCWGVRHGRRLESDEQLDSFDAFIHDATMEMSEELEEMYNRPSLFDQDAE